LERISADEERVKRENFAEALVFHVSAGHLPDRTVGAETNEVGSNTEHVGEMGEGLVGQFNKRALEDGVSFTDKTAVPFEVIGSEPADFFLHFLLVAGVFEGISVVPDDPVKGFARDDSNVVGSFLLVEGEELIEEEGGGKDGGTGIVGETLVAEDGGASPGLIEGLEESDLISAGLKANGRGQSTESGADDDGGGAGG